MYCSGRLENDRTTTWDLGPHQSTAVFWFQADECCSPHNDSFTCGPKRVVAVAAVRVDLYTHKALSRSMIQLFPGCVR